MPLSYIKMPEGVSQELAVSQTGYMTKRNSDNNFTAHNPSMCDATYCVTIDAILFDINILVKINL